MVVDMFGLLYGAGEGLNGCLGTGDKRSRINLVLVKHIRGIEVINVACGDGFTVVLGKEREDRRDFEQMLDEKTEKRTKKTTKKMDETLNILFNDAHAKSIQEKSPIEKLLGSPKSRIKLPYMNVRLYKPKRQIDRVGSRLQYLDKKLCTMYKKINKELKEVPILFERSEPIIKHNRTTLNICYNNTIETSDRQKEFITPSRQVINAKRLKEMGIERSKSLFQRKKQKKLLMVWVKGKKISVFP